MDQLRTDTWYVHVHSSKQNWLITEISSCMLVSFYMGCSCYSILVYNAKHYGGVGATLLAVDL